MNPDPDEPQAEDERHPAEIDDLQVNGSGSDDGSGILDSRDEAGDPRVNDLNAGDEF